MKNRNEIPRQAETESGASDTEVVKRKLAEHKLIGADGAEVESEEEADGISYQIIKDKDTGEAVSLPAFTFKWSDASEAARKMIFLFGAKTLATNESSAARQAKEGPTDAAAQMAAVAERFALINSGSWVDRTREGVGAKIDKDALAAAIAAVATDAGKQVDLVQIRQKLEDDPGFVRATRQVPAIATEYAKRAGRPTKSVDDVLGMLG